MFDQKDDRIIYLNIFVLLVPSSSIFKYTQQITEIIIWTCIEDNMLMKYSQEKPKSYLKRIWVSLRVSQRMDRNNKDVRRVSC